MHIVTIAPSGSYSEQSYVEARDFLAENGFEFSSQANLRSDERPYLNGSDEYRLAELQNALNSSADICWIVRGGYGLTRILPNLQLQSSKRTPIVIGHSDGTALLAHLWTQHQVKGIHGPNLLQVQKEPESSLDSMWKILHGKSREIIYPSLMSSRNSSEIREIHGTLLPFNLCVLTHLIGTHSMPNLAGSILMLEDVNEVPYRIDRMLTQLWAAGSLNGVKAVIIGYLTGCDEPNNSYTAKQAILDRFAGLNIPVFTDFPFGHNVPNWSLPFGAKAMINIPSFPRRQESRISSVGRDPGLHGNDNFELKILEEIF